MKKFIYMAIAALMSVGLASCQGNNDPEFQGPIQIAVSEITPTSAICTCTPDDAEKPYFFTYYPKAVFDTITSEQIVQDVKDEMDYIIGFISMMFGQKASYGDLASRAVYSDTIANLMPDTKYVAVAYYVDAKTGMPVSDMTLTTFTTSKLQVLGKKDVHFSNIEWYDFVEEEGWWQILAADSKDTTYMVSLSPMLCTQVEGSYMLDDMYPAYTTIMDIQTGESDCRFVEIKVDVTKENGMYIVKANGLATNGYRYNMTFDPIDPSTAIMDAPARNVEATRATKKSLRPVHRILRHMGTVYSLSRD